MNCNRRQFIASSAAGVGALALTKSGLAATQKHRSVAAIIKDAKAISDRNETKPDRCLGMVRQALSNLSGAKDEKQAWVALGLRPNDVVAIKLNCNRHNFPLYSHPDLTMAVCDSLKTVIPENSIIIYERYSSELERAGYIVNRSAKGVRCTGTEEGDGFDAKSKITKIVTKQATKVIHIPTLKYAGGDFAASMFVKGHIGSIVPADMPSCHGDPLVCTRVLNDDAVKDKNLLNICDALRATYDRKVPWYEKSIIASVDPIAAEVVSLDVLNRKRKQEGLAIEEVKDYIRKADTQFKLGTADLTEIKVMKKDLS